jgi:Ca2+/H+ antiporter, TMEM165/GDT1 family
MDALLVTFIAVFLAEMGDRNQILSGVLAQRFENNRAIIGGLMMASLVNCSLSVGFGSIVDNLVSEEPLRLFTALAYIFAGGAMLLWRRRVHQLVSWHGSPWLISFLGMLFMQFGDKSQFIIGVNSANTSSWGFPLAGGLLGILAANVPAVIWREEMASAIPIRAIRLAGGVLLLLYGIYLALGAFALISRVT